MWQIGAEEQSPETLWNALAEIKQAVQLPPNRHVLSRDGWVLVISISSCRDKGRRKSTSVAISFQEKDLEAPGA